MTSRFSLFRCLFTKVIRDCWQNHKTFVQIKKKNFFYLVCLILQKGLNYRFYNIELVRCVIQQSVECISLCWEKRAWRAISPSRKIISWLESILVLVRKTDEIWGFCSAWVRNFRVLGKSPRKIPFFRSCILLFLVKKGLSLPPQH